MGQLIVGIDTTNRGFAATIDSFETAVAVSGANEAVVPCPAAGFEERHLKPTEYR